MDKRLLGATSTPLIALRSLGKKETVVPRDKKYKGTTLLDRGTHYQINEKVQYPPNHVVNPNDDVVTPPSERHIQTVYPTNLSDADTDKLGTFMTTSQEQLAYSQYSTPHSFYRCLANCM